MKKILLTGAALLALSINAKAQETLLETTWGTTDAELTVEAADYLFGELDSDDDTWTFYNDSDFQEIGFEGIVAASASFLVEADGETLTPTSPQNLLITPVIDLTNYVTSTLSYKIGGYMGATASMSYQILILDEAQLMDENLDLSTVQPAFAGQVLETGSEDLTLDLTNYIGQNIDIVFVHTESTGLGYLLLDDITVTASDVAGVKHVVSSSVSVFPNPSSNVVNVANAGSVNNVAIVDINGRTVKSTKFNGVTEAQVNISDLTSGVYMMTISSDKGNVTKKIVKN